MTYPAHALPFPTRWNDNDVYGHLNNTVYYEAMDTTINVWLMTVGRPRPDRRGPDRRLRVVVVRVHGLRRVPRAARGGPAGRPAWGRRA